MPHVLGSCRSRQWWGVLFSWDGNLSWSPSWNCLWSLRVLIQSPERFPSSLSLCGISACSVMAWSCTEQAMDYLLKACPKSVIRDKAFVCVGEALGCSFQPSIPPEAKLRGRCMPTACQHCSPNALQGFCSLGGAENLQVLSAPCKRDWRDLTPKQTALCCFVFDNALPNNSVAKGSNAAVRLPFPKTPNAVYHIINV